jgi:DNA polymerase III delta prime subunit
MQANPVSLYEQYRPSTWAQVVGQGKAINTIGILRRRGLSGRIFWIVGDPGTGKTTIAHLIADELASDWCITEMDAKPLDVADMVQAERDWQYMGMGKPGRVLIVNEAQGLKPSVVTHLLTVTERIPRHVTLIFTTSHAMAENLFDEPGMCEKAGKDKKSMFLSRCDVIELARRDLAQAFAERAHEIALKENLNGRPIEAYLRLARDCGNNMREMLKRIERGAMLA